MNKAAFSRITTLVDKYLDYLELVRNASQYTIRNYRFCLARFCGVIQKPWADVTADDIMKFRIALKASGIGHNWTTFHMIVLKEFFRWLMINDYPVYPYHKIDVPKYEERAINVLDRPSLEKLFKVTHPKLLISLRNTAIIHTLYSTGCRVSELCSLTRYQVGPEVHIVGKGNKRRLVFFSKKALAAVRRYLNTRQDRYAPLFISHGRNKGHALTKEMVELVVKRYARKAGVLKITPHGIRHTFATQLLRNGASLPAIQQMLGHSSIRTTQIYLHITNPELQATHKSYHR